MASNDLFGETPPSQDSPGHDPYGWGAANFGRYDGSAALRSDPSAENGTPLPADQKAS